MRRRRVLELAALSTTAIASSGLAGCIGSGSPGAGGGADPATTTDDDQPTSTTTTTTTTTQDPLPCPQVRSVSTHVCPGDDHGSLFVDRSAREMPATDGSLTVTVTNTSDGPVGLNPYAWAVHRQTAGGGWERVDDRAYIEPWEQVDAGDSVRWRIASDADAATTGGAIGCALDLDPGTYGWSVELEPADGTDRVAAAAAFVVR